MMTINAMKRNQRAKVTELETNASVREKLCSMGLGPGRSFRLIRNHARQPYLLGLEGSDTNIALDRELAEGIHVTLLEN